MKTCTVTGCDRVVRTRTLCNAHYKRLLAGKALAPPIQECIRDRPATCTVDGCDRPHSAKNYCTMHYHRWKAHGDPLARLGADSWAIRPTPHDRITYQGWNLTSVPLPDIAAIHDAFAAEYDAQNAHDGVLSDPEYIAAVRAWRAASLDMAAD